MGVCMGSRLLDRFAWALDHSDRCLMIHCRAVDFAFCQKSFCTCVHIGNRTQSI